MRTTYPPIFYGNVVDLDLSAFQDLPEEWNNNRYTIITNLLLKEEVDVVKFTNGGFFIPFFLGVKIKNDLMIKQFSDRLAQAIWDFFDEDESVIASFEGLLRYCDKLDDKSIRKYVKLNLNNRWDAILNKNARADYVYDLTTKFSLPPPTQTT